MLRYNTVTEENEENKKVDRFIEDVIKVCKNYGFSISHEDSFGAFEITDINKHDIEWLRCAHYDPQQEAKELGE